MIPTPLPAHGPLPRDRRDTLHRMRRHRRETADLADALATVLRCHPSASDLGPDPAVEGLQRIYGLAPGDACVLSARVGGRRVTVVAAPSRVWRKPALRRNLLGLKRAARRAGRRVVLATRRAICREPRLSNLELLLSCAHVPVSARDRVAVVQRLVAEPGAVLEDLAEVVRASDPVAAVLSLAASGILSLPCDRPIGPFTPLDLA